MRKSTIYALEHRRKRKGLTNYRRRLKILASHKPRLVVRKSLKNVQASIAEFNKKGDLVKSHTHSRMLKKLGWKYSTSNLPAAYLIGLLLGKKAKNRGVEEAVLDIGLQKSVKGSRIYAVLAGVLDAGLRVPHQKEMLPSRERISGDHIASYAQQTKKDESLHKKQFGKHVKQNVDPESITKNFEEVKSRIEQSAE